jgi:hypothetical protein
MGEPADIARISRDWGDEKSIATVRGNPRPPAQLTAIGHFVSLTFRSDTKAERSIRAKHGQHYWLAWKGDPDTGDLIIVKPGPRVRVSGADLAPHHRFHGADPAAWESVSWSPPRQPLERLGFVTAITYRVPDRKMPSNKNGGAEAPTDYVHNFGDFGAGDDRSTDKRLHPAVAVGGDGTVYIMRRAGNAYRLGDWLYG